MLSSAENLVFLIVQILFAVIVIIGLSISQHVSESVRRTIGKFFPGAERRNGKYIVGLKAFSGILDLKDGGNATAGDKDKGTSLTFNVPAALSQHGFSVSLQGARASEGDNLTDDDFRRLLATSYVDESMEGILFQPMVVLALRRLHELKGGFRISLGEGGFQIFMGRKLRDDDLETFLAAATVVFHQVCKVGARLFPELAKSALGFSERELAPTSFLDLNNFAYIHLGGKERLDFEQLVYLLNAQGTLSSESIYDSIGLDIPAQGAESDANALPSCEAPTESVDGGDGLQTSRPPVPSVSDL